MKTLIKMLCVFIVAVVAMPVSGWAEVVIVSSQVRDSFVGVNAYSDNGCGYITASADGGDRVTHFIGGKPGEFGYTNAYAYGYNYCTGELLSGWGSTDIRPTISYLDNATLSIPVNLISCTWSSCTDLGTATLTANLTGTGDVTRGISMNNTSSGPYRSISRLNGLSRGADVSMSLILNGTDLLAGSMSMSYGNLYKVNQGSHSFYRY